MANNPHSEDQENEHFVLISGNIDNFFGNSNKPKPHLNADDIYDLSSLPQDTHKPLMNESEANFTKTNNNEIMHSDPFVDSFRNLKEIKEEQKQHSIENIPEVEKLENEEDSMQKDSNKFEKHFKKTPSLSFTAKTELQSPPKMEKPKKIESAHESPINKFDFQPIIKTLQKTADNLDKYMKNNETVKKEKEKEKSSNEIKSPQTPAKENEIDADQQAKEDLKVLKKKRTKKSEKSQKIEASNKDENNNLHEEEHKETPQVDNEAIENPENEEKEIKQEKKKEKNEKKKEKHSKKKKKTKKDKQKENDPSPPIISVGIPMSANDAFDRSFNESPDLLIKFIF